MSSEKHCPPPLQKAGELGREIRIEQERRGGETLRIQARGALGAVAAPVVCRAAVSPKLKIEILIPFFPIEWELEKSIKCLPRGRWKGRQNTFQGCVWVTGVTDA